MNEKQNQSENTNDPIQTEQENTRAKKPLITLSSFIILILLIIIVIMGIYIYKQNQAINQASCVIDPLQSSNIISKLQNKNENINNTSTTENTLEEYTPELMIQESKTLTEKQSETLATNTLEKYLSKNLTAYENSNIGPMPDILLILDLETNENIEQLCSNNYDSKSYIRSNTKYTDFKNALLEYVSEEYFTENFSQYTNINDNVAFCNCAGGFVPYELYEINFKSRENDIYTFSVILKDIEMYEHAINPEENEDISESDYLIEQEASFKLINNEKLVIHKM